MRFLNSSLELVDERDLDRSSSKAPLWNLEWCFNHKRQFLNQSCNPWHRLSELEVTSLRMCCNSSLQFTVKAEENPQRAICYTCITLVRDHLFLIKVSFEFRFYTYLRAWSRWGCKSSRRTAYEEKIVYGNRFPVSCEFNDATWRREGMSQECFNTIGNMNLTHARFSKCFLADQLQRWWCTKCNPTKAQAPAEAWITEFFNTIGNAKA